MSRVVGSLVSLLLVLASGVPGAGAEDQDETVPYTAVVGGWEEGCAADATLDLLIGAAKSIGASLGTGGFPGDAHCVAVSPGAVSLAVRADDATGAPVRVIVAQHSADDHLTGTTLCGAGAVALVPGAVDVSLTLMPYSATATPCPGAVPPTTGTLHLSWS